MSHFYRHICHLLKEKEEEKGGEVVQEQPCNPTGKLFQLNSVPLSPRRNRTGAEKNKEATHAPRTRTWPRATPVPARA